MLSNCPQVSMSFNMRCLQFSNVKVSQEKLLSVCSCVQYRWNVYRGIRDAIEKNEGGLEKFSQGDILLLERFSSAP